MDALRALGCDVAQGYYFGRPMTAAGMTELMARMGTIHPDQVPADR